MLLETGHISVHSFLSPLPSLHPDWVGLSAWYLHQAGSCLPTLSLHLLFKSYLVLTKDPRVSSQLAMELSGCRVRMVSQPLLLKLPPPELASEPSSDSQASVASL